MEDKLSELQDKGFSKEVLERIEKPQKASTQNLYLFRYNKFVEWAGLEDKQKVTIPLVADFLLHLFEEKKLSTGSIEGYKTAIAQLCKYSGAKIAESQELKDLIQSFKRDRPKASRAVPKWDLSLVLSLLARKPYEPLEEADLKWVTLKTVFLVALATGRRRSELHALVKSKVLFKEKQNLYLLGLDPSFLAKNQLADDISEKFKFIEIKSLKSFLGEDPVYDPVRALTIYLKKSEPMRSDSQKKLFISFLEGKRSDIHANTISAWLKSVISQAYKDVHLNNELQTKLNVKAHDVRALASSWAAISGTNHYNK